jgi:hypothetical protein
VVAFSFAAMANTGEGIEKVVISSDNKVEILVEDCQTKAINYIDNEYDKDGTHTPRENHDALNAYLAGCQGKEASISAN